MITLEELGALMPHLPALKRVEYLPCLQGGMAEFEITSRLREAAFLAQVAHESGELRWLWELWGPTQAQRNYEGMRRLGNTQTGDGYRYRGRGWIQLTGRSNYRQAGRALHLQLEAEPEQAATPGVAARVAGWFWRSRGLNQLADEGTEQAFRRITKRVNGGYNGWEDRLGYYRRALLVLSDDEAEAAPVWVYVNGHLLHDVETLPFLRGGTLMVPARPVCELAGYRLLSVVRGTAVVQDTGRGVHRLPMLLRGMVGYVALRDLPGVVRWDEKTRTGYLDA